MAAIKARSDMKELRDIKSEIDRLSARLKELKTKKIDIESNIAKFLEQTDQPGIKFEELVVMQKDKKITTRKKVEEKQQDVVKILEYNGISDSKGLYKKIQEAMKGKQKIVTGLDIKEQKRKF